MRGGSEAGSLAGEVRATEAGDGEIEVGGKQEVVLVSGEEEGCCCGGARPGARDGAEEEVVVSGEEEGCCGARPGARGGAEGSSLPPRRRSRAVGWPLLDRRCW